MTDLDPEWLDLRERLWQQGNAADERPLTRGSINHTMTALQRGSMPDQRRWQNLGRAR